MKAVSPPEYRRCHRTPNFWSAAGSRPPRPSRLGMDSPRQRLQGQGSGCRAARGIFHDSPRPCV